MIGPAMNQGRYGQAPTPNRKTRMMDRQGGRGSMMSRFNRAVPPPTQGGFTPQMPPGGGFNSPMNPSGGMNTGVAGGMGGPMPGRMEGGYSPMQNNPNTGIAGGLFGRQEGGLGRMEGGLGTFNPMQNNPNTGIAGGLQVGPMGDRMGGIDQGPLADRYRRGQIQTMY